MKRGQPLDPRASVLRLATGVESSLTDTGVLRLRAAPVKPWGPLRALAWLMRVPKRAEVELDAIGTWVIAQLDDRSLAQLAIDLGQHLKLSRREAETALADFTNMLVKRHLVEVVALTSLNAGDSAQQAGRDLAPRASHSLSPQTTSP